MSPSLARQSFIAESPPAKIRNQTMNKNKNKQASLFNQKLSSEEDNIYKYAFKSYAQ